MNMVARARSQERSLPRSCANVDGSPKIAYPNRVDARAAAHATGSRGDGTPAGAYRCDHHGWHVGHSAERSPFTNAGKTLLHSILHDTERWPRDVLADVMARIVDIEDEAADRARAGLRS